MRTVPDWDTYFLIQARAAAVRSKDPSRQVGCVIIDPESRKQQSGGYNGFVMGVVETEELWKRPVKYKYVCHAEFNAVALAARNGSSLRGCHAYITCFPCLTCARLLVQAGVKRVVVEVGEVASGYQEEFREAGDLLMEAGVVVRVMEIGEK